jgi:S-sulfo-L-cysteine synthase (O-acetyl-L-serine-dependent)
LLDATSGNTGIAYATMGKQLWIPVTLCLPENASHERKDILQSLGVEIIYTLRFEGTRCRPAGSQITGPINIFMPINIRTTTMGKHIIIPPPWKYSKLCLALLILLPVSWHYGNIYRNGSPSQSLNPGIHCPTLQADHPLHVLEGWKHMETAIVPGIYDNTLADDKSCLPLRTPVIESVLGSQPGWSAARSRKIRLGHCGIHTAR